MATTTRTVRIPEQLDTVRVLGPNDEVIRELEHAFTHITMHIRGLDVTIRSTSRAGESEASEAEDMLHTIIDAAYREPMDAVTARRMLDQRVLSNTVRDEALAMARQPTRCAGRAPCAATMPVTRAAPTANRIRPA